MPAALASALASAPRGDASWVLHLVPPNGGGVDRFVRDLLQHRPADRVLHVAPEQWVLEDAAGQFSPLIPDAPALLAALGHPGWVHAHAVEPAVRDAAAQLCATRQTLPPLALALTLHDITFTFGDAQEQQARLAFVARATLLTAPSHYIANRLAGEANRFQLPPLSICHVIPNGSDPLPEVPTSELPPPAEPLGHSPAFDVAVVGAVGAHKGLDHLLKTVAAATPDLKVVVLGYVDGQLSPGWHVADRLWVHGAFEPAQLSSLLARYRVRRVWFPAGQPESFSYALSDVWQAGWPVLVPDHGALGERVRAHGRPTDHGYPPDLPPDATARLLADLLATDPVPAANTAAAAGAIISTATMAQAYAELYLAGATPAPTASATATATALPASLCAPVTYPERTPHIDLQQLAQQHLNSHFFRQELLRLQGESLAQQVQQENCRRELQDLASAHQARGEWIAKLEEDAQRLNETLHQEQQHRYRVEAELTQPIWRIGVSRLRRAYKKISKKFGPP